MISTDLTLPQLFPQPLPAITKATYRTLEGSGMRCLVDLFCCWKLLVGHRELFRTSLKEVQNVHEWLQSTCWLDANHSSWKKVVHLFVTSFVKKWDHFVFFRCWPLHLNGELQGPWFWKSNGHLKWLSHAIIDDNTLTRTTRCSGFCYFCNEHWNEWRWTLMIHPHLFSHDVWDIWRAPNLGSNNTCHAALFGTFFFRELYLDRQKGRGGGLYIVELWIPNSWGMDANTMRL